MKSLFLLSKTRANKNLNNKYIKRRKAHEFGIFSEIVAVWYLRLKFYRILTTRHKNQYGEIDILAKRGKTLIIVEVKARGDMAECDESVTSQKRRKIIKSFNWLIASGGNNNKGRRKIAGLSQALEHNIRCDVIFIARGFWPHHIKNAWSL